MTTPQPLAVGQRYRLPWRDYAEVEIVELPYDGNFIDFRIVESGALCGLARNTWELWMGSTAPEATRTPTERKTDAHHE
jgi:hypothetical protein